MIHQLTDFRRQECEHGAETMPIADLQSIAHWYNGLNTFCRQLGGGAASEVRAKTNLKADGRGEG